MMHTSVTGDARLDVDFLLRLIDSLPVPVSYLGPDLTVRFCGRATGELLGLPAEQVVGRRADELFASEAGAFEALQRTVDTATPQHFELTHRGEGEREQIWDLSFVPDVVDGQLAGIVTVGFDVTDLARARHRCEEAEQAYRLIGELVPYGTWTAELDGAVTYLSDSFVEMTGRAPDDLLGWRWIDLLETEEERRREVSAWRSAIVSGKRDTKHRIKAHDGSYRSVLCRGVRLLDERGRPFKWAGIHVDVTGQERLLAFREALSAVKDSLVTAPAINELLAGVADAVATAAEADSCAVLAPEDGNWQTLYSAGERGWLRSHKRFPREQLQPAARAFRSGEIVIESDVRVAGRSVEGRAREEEIPSLAVLPIRRRGKPLCLLALEYIEKPIVADDPLRHFFSDLLGALDLALQATSARERERHVADTLQQSLLIMPAHPQGVRVAHLYQPATEGDRVGGDFYDVFDVGGRVAFLIGDVSGSGIEAAALTALVKNALRAHLVDGQTPSEALRKTNLMFYQFTEAHEFATAGVGILDGRSGDLSYASAGHPAPIRVGPSGTEIVAASGLLLGAFPEVEYEDCVCRLAEDQILFLYTDGLIEARAGDELFGEKRLIGLIDSLEEREPSDLVRRAFNAVTSYTGGHIGDDVAILAVQRSR